MWYGGGLVPGSAVLAARNVKNIPREDLRAKIEELAHAAIFVVAVFDELARRVGGKSEELAFENITKKPGRPFIIAVSTAVWLRDNFVDNP